MRKCRLARTGGADKNARMSNDLVKQMMADIIKGIMEDNGWSAARLAKEAGVAASTVTRALDMSVKFVPSSRTMGRLNAARWKGAQYPPEIREIAAVHENAPRNIDAQPVRRRIPISGEVRAGAWIEIPDDPTVTDWLYFDDPEFKNVRVYALRVVGNSMDRLYPDGTTVLVADATDTGVFEGDIVVVRRSRGPAVETTLKELMIEGRGKYALWPRSNDPLFQEPIRIDATEAEYADEGPEVIGIVIGSYTKRERQARRMVNFDVTEGHWAADETD